MAAAIYGRYDENILLGITPTSTAAPSTSYALATFLQLNPAARVLFGATSLTLTWTLGSGKTGAILVIPMHNLTPGSSSVLTLTNGAGLSQAITIPTPLKTNGLPVTLAYDFSALSNRNSNTWNLVIASNASNVAFGAAVAIYSTKNDLSGVAGGNIGFQITESETHMVKEVTNEYGTPYVQDYNTAWRQIQAKVIGKTSELAALLNWFRAGHGRALPSFLWPDPIAPDPYFGRWQQTYQTQAISGIRKSLTMTFDEWAKGQPF